VTVSRRTLLVADADSAATTHLTRLLDGLGLDAVVGRTVAEVLSHLENRERRIDAMFIDLGSAELGGARVLTAVRDQYPDLPVVICASGGSKAELVFAIRSRVVDWIDKPASLPAVTEAIKRVAREARRGLPRPGMAGAGTPTPAPAPRSFVAEIARRVFDGTIALPEIPQVLDELRRTLSNLDVSPAEVLRVLEKDPAIAAQVVATANTAAYGGRGRIQDLRSAVARLGNRSIAGIAQAAALRGLFAFKLPAFRKVFQRMWSAHILTATLARELATEIRDPDPEQVFMVCLMHNAGEQFMLRIMGEICQKQREQVVSMEEVLGALRDTHTAFGTALLKKWEMGALFEQVARRHHEAQYDAPELDARARTVLHLCNLADRLVNERGQGLYNDTLPGPDVDASFEALGIPETRRAHFANRVLEVAADIAPMIG
jgi:HD-like signal output (HDOD) protein/CheY-like chemotaxis protein